MSHPVIEHRAVGVPRNASFEQVGAVLDKLGKEGWTYSGALAGVAAVPAAPPDLRGESGPVDLSRAAQAASHNVEVSYLIFTRPKAPPAAPTNGKAPAEVPGWTEGLEDLYRRTVRELPNGATFVEVGVYQGKSLLIAIEEARRIGKRLKFVAVDHFLGSPEHQNEPDVKAGRLRQLFEANLERANCREHVEVVAEESTAAATLYGGCQFRFVFLDASHDEESVRADIEAWLPRVAPGGTLAGHDWHGWPGVRAAVTDLLGEVDIVGDCWVYRVPAARPEAAVPAGATA